MFIRPIQRRPTVVLRDWTASVRHVKILRAGNSSVSRLILSCRAAGLVDSGTKSRDDRSGQGLVLCVVLSIRHPGFLPPFGLSPQVLFHCRTGLVRQDYSGAHRRLSAGASLPLRADPKKLSSSGARRATDVIGTGIMSKQGSPED